MRNWIIGFLVSVCVTFSASATLRSYHAIKSVTLEPITACQGDEVDVTVQVELAGRYYDVKKWKSTSIDGVCYEHDNHMSNYGMQVFTETFVIIAPGTQGLGNVQVKTFAGDDCNNQQKTKNVDLTVIQCCRECEDGDDCTVEQYDGYVAITCGDTVAYLYDGEDGEDGEPGPRGIPGLSCTVEQDGLCAYIFCEDETSAVVCNGEDGARGPSGPQGEPGESCYVVQEYDCAVIYCGDTPVSVICDGLDGDDGADGLDGVDGAGCEVVDNEDSTCTIVCVDSDATVYDCGIGAEPEEVVTATPDTGMCGTFGGVTIVAMLLPLGFMRFRSRRHCG